MSQTPEPPRHVVRALVALDRRGGRLARETIESYERARRELLGMILAAPDSPLTVLRYQAILRQIDERLSLLYQDVSVKFGVMLAHTAQIEAEQAIHELRVLTRGITHEGALTMQPVVPHEMVRSLVENAGEHIKAVNQDLRGKIRNSLTQSMIRGESTHKAARAVMGEGLTLDGIKPVFPSVYARAQAIARTEMSTAANVSHMATYTEAAKTLPNLRVQWAAHLCSRTCDRCRDTLNGLVREPGKVFAYGLVAPPAHPRCLCRLVAVMAAATA